MPNQTMQGLAGLLAEQGRYGDTMLMHVSPEEVQYLDSIGGISRNPITDLPEAFKLKDLLPFVGSAVLGPAFKSIGFSPGVSNFLASTAATMLGGGSLEKGIMSGLVSSSIGRLGQNLSETAPGAKVAPADTGYKFGIFKKPETGTFGSRYAEAFSSPQFNPVEQVRLATEGGLENFLEQIQKPSVMIPFTIGAGELGRLSAEEQYAKDFANFQESQKRRRAELQRKYPQVLPGPRQFLPPPPTGFTEGGAIQRKFDGGEFSFGDFANPSDFQFYYEPNFIDQFLPANDGREMIMPVDSAPVFEAEAVDTIQPTPDQEIIRIEQERLAEIERQALLQRQYEEARAREAQAAYEREQARVEGERRAAAEAAERQRIAQEDQIRIAREYELARQEASRQEAIRQAEVQRVAQIEAERQAEAARQAEAVRQEAARRAAEEVSLVPRSETVAITPEPPVSPIQSALATEEPPAPSYRGDNVPISQPSPPAEEDYFYTPRGEEEIITPVSTPIAPPPATSTQPQAQYDEKGNLIASANSPLNSPMSWIERMKLFGAVPAILPNLVTAGTGGKDLTIGDLYKNKRDEAVKDFEEKLKTLKDSNLYTPELEQGLRTNLNYTLENLAQEETGYLNSLPQRQTLSNLLSSNQFTEAYKFAQDNGMQMLLLRPDQLRDLRQPFTKDEAMLFIRSMPYEFIKSAYGDRYKFEEAFKFDPEGAESRGALAWVTGLDGKGGEPKVSETGYPMLERVLKPQEVTNKTGIFEKIFKVAAITAAVFGGAHFLGLTGGTAAVPGATAGGAGGAGGAAAGVGGGFVAAPTVGGIQTIVVPAVTGSTGALVGAGTGILAGTQVVGGGSTGAGTTSGTTSGTPGTGTTTLPPDIPTITVTGTAPVTGSLTVPAVVAGGAAGATTTGGATGATTTPVEPPPPEPTPPEPTPPEPPPPDLPTVTVTGTAPVTGSLTVPAVVAGGAAASTTAGGAAGATTTPVEPPIEEFTISTGNPDFPYITIPAGSVAEKILNQTQTGDTGRTDSWTDKAKGILTDYAQSQAISAALAALAGGAAGAGGVGGAGKPGYQGTGGLGYLPEGQERRYIAAPEDYMHGFMPEFSFFENLNPPALIDTGTPGPTQPDERDLDDRRILPGPSVERATGGILPRRKVYSERGYIDLIQGYQEGGEVEKEESYEELPGPVTDGNKRLVELTKKVILGQVVDRADEIIQKFIDMFGLDAFQDMREDLLEEAMPNSTKEGMIPGHTGGMDDMVDGVIGNQERVAVSPGEYIIPADVVSALGDGNSKKGEKELDSLLDRVRKSKYGSTKQPPPINIGKVMPV